MAIVVRFKLYGEEAEAVDNFARQIGVPIDTVAKQALFMTISRAVKSAQELQKQMGDTNDPSSKPEQHTDIEGELDGKSRVSPRYPEETLERTDAPTNALATSADDTNSIAD